MRRSTLLVLTTLLGLAAACGSEEPAPPAPSTAPGTPSASSSLTPEEAAKRGIVPPPPLFAADVDPEWFEWPPGPRAPYQGMDGFNSVSQVEMAVTPGVMHRLDVTHIFPNRTRWAVAIPGFPERGRILEYRYGDHRFRHDSTRLASLELSGSNRLAGLRQMDLRVALMVYPGPYDWEVSEDGTRAVVELGEGRGSLRAELDDEGRPTAITSLTPTGVEQETVRIESWQEIRGRTWPKDMVVEAEGELVWRERLKDVTTRLTLLDRYFIPVDYNSLPVGEIDLTAPRLVDLPPMTIRPVPLPPSSSWTDSLALVRQARDSLLIATPTLDLDPATSFELAHGPVPSSFWMRLTGDAVPEGWQRIPARRGATLFVEEPVHLEKHVGTLQDALPEGSRPQIPYVTYHPAGEAPPRFQLILPFE